jgi:hypothetical protein
LIKNIYYFAFDISFIANIKPVFFYSAFQTRPNPPEPIWKIKVKSERYFCYFGYFYESNGAIVSDVFFVQKTDW